MSSFVITKRFNDLYKFEFTSRRGKTIFTSLAFKLKFECEAAIEVFKINLDEYIFEKQSISSDKHVFKILYNDSVIAISRKYSTELRSGKGIADIKKYAEKAEILDFSNQDFVFEENSETL